MTTNPPSLAGGQALSHRYEERPALSLEYHPSARRRHIRGCSSGPAFLKGRRTILLLHFVNQPTNRRSCTDPTNHIPNTLRQSAHPPTRSWWSRTGSNRRPPACKAGALPTELRPLTALTKPSPEVVGPGRLELPTSRLSGVRSNHLSYGPKLQDPRRQPCGERVFCAFGKKEKRRRRNPQGGLI